MTYQLTLSELVGGKMMLTFVSSFPSFSFISTECYQRRPSPSPLLFSSLSLPLLLSPGIRRGSVSAPKDGSTLTSMSLMPTVNEILFSAALEKKKRDEKR